MELPARWIRVSHVLILDQPQLSATGLVADRLTGGELPHLFMAPLKNILESTVAHVWALCQNHTRLRVPLATNVSIVTPKGLVSLCGVRFQDTHLDLAKSPANLIWRACSNICLLLMSAAAMSSVAAFSPSAAISDLRLLISDFN